MYPSEPGKPPTGESGLKKRPGESSIEKPVDVEIKSISKSRAWLIVGSTVLSVDRGDNGFRFIVWKTNGDPVRVVEFKSLDELDEEQLFEDPNYESVLKDAIKQLITNWEYYHVKYSLGEIAQIMGMPEYRGLEPRVTSTDVLAKIAADAIKKSFRVAELTSGGNPIDLFCREGVVWKPCRGKLESFIGSMGELYGIFGKKISKQFVERVLYYVGITSRKEVEYRGYVAFGNKVLDLESFVETGNLWGSFLDPEHIDVYHRVEHEIDLSSLLKAEGIRAYIPPRGCSELVEMFKALAPRTYSYFKQLVEAPGLECELVNSRVCFLAQLIGRMLYPGYRHRGTISRCLKNVFVLIGPPNTGKSTFIVNYVGEVVLGKDNFKVGNISRLTSMDPEDRLRELGDLYNVLMVVFPDIGKKTAMHDWSALTGITGGDPVKARKLRRDAFEYYPAYKIVFTTNSPPPLPSEEEIKRAIIDRMRVLEMKNTFNGSLDIRPLVEEVPRALIVYLYALRTIFTSGWADTGVASVEDLWLRYSEPLYKLLVEMIEAGVLVKCNGCEISTSDLYSFIQEYVTEKTACREEECEEDEQAQVLPRQDAFTKQLKTWAPLLGVRVVKKKGYTYVKGLTTRSQLTQHKPLVPSGASET
ncbi:MAG: DUF5906 domain-containing protein [Thermofilaceae archaeon]